WRVLGAQRIRISNLEGFEESQTVGPDQEDSLIVPVGKEGRFLLTATNGAHQSERTYEIQVLQPPHIAVFDADRPYWTEGTTEFVAVLLSWEIDGATVIELDSDSMGPIDLHQKH